MSERVRIYKPSTIKKMGMDLLENSKGMHHITSLVELDFSEYRESIRSYRSRNNKGLSVLSFIIKGLADTLAKHPNIQTFQFHNNKAIEFYDVDVSFMIEKELDGVYIPSTYIIRTANNKTIEEVHQEIEECIRKKIENDSPFANRKSTTLFNIYPYLPRRIRLFILKQIGKHPFYIKKIGGTALVTSLANFGSTSAWILPLASFPFVLGIGTLTKKPWIVNDEIKVCQIQNLTFQFNHDYIDGSDAARFIKSLEKKFDDLKQEIDRITST